MTLLSVTRDVCATVGVAVPQSVFSGITSNRTMLEMLALANEMAQRIAYDYRDWTRLRKMQTFNGDGLTTAFTLPNNYKRMLLKSNVRRSVQTQYPLMFIPDTDEWMRRRVENQVDTWSEWTLIGGQIHIFPVLALNEQAWFAYLDSHCISFASGGTGTEFQADGDSFMLDERLLKLGMIWEWKSRKGGTYAEDVATFGDAMAKAMGADGPAPIIVDRRRAPWMVESSYDGVAPP
jgi:hypothetical protein